MIKRINFYILIPVVIIVLILSTPIFGGLLIKRIPLNSQEGFDRTVPLNQNQAVVQYVKLEKDNFSGLGLSIKNPFLANKEDLILNLTQDGKLVRSLTVSGVRITDGDFMKLEFEPIKDSAGQTYRAEFISPRTTPVESFAIYATDSKQSYGGELFSNSEKIDGMLSMVVLTAPGSYLKTIFSIYDDFFSQIFKDIFFTLFYFFVLTILGLLIVRAYFKKD